MKENEVAALVRGLAPGIRGLVTEAMAPLAARLAELEARPVLKGDPGEPGAEGPQGLAGPGPAGPEGQAGPKGDVGEVGPQGLVGPPGEVGERGVEGPIGPKGDVGDPGHIGEQGWPGDKGEKGDPGRDGRDASDLVLLYNRIDERVSTVIADQFKAASITSPDSGRTIFVRFGDTTHEIKTGIPLDRGVWKEGTYELGDSVSHGGSLFIAKIETTEKPGNTSGDWRLSVKRGADGRDWRPEEKRVAEPVRFK